MHKLQAGALAALIQRYSVVGDVASAASRLGSFMHLLGSTRVRRCGSRAIMALRSAVRR